MARPKKPVSQRTGNWGNEDMKSKYQEAEEKLKGKDDLIENPPEILSDIAKQYYIFLVSELKETGVLGNLDIPLIAQTADCLAKMDEADEILNKEGIMISIFDRNGNCIPKEHPIVKTKNTYLTQFRALATQLGMSPSARAQLVNLKLTKESEAEDPLLQILAMNGNGENGN